jgi:hypothetical protein
MGLWIMVKKDGVHRVEDKYFYSDKVKCSKCGRALKTYSKCIGNRQKALCETCYTEMAFPFLISSYMGAH